MNSNSEFTCVGVSETELEAVDEVTPALFAAIDADDAWAEGAAGVVSEKPEWNNIPQKLNI